MYQLEISVFFFMIHFFIDFFRHVAENLIPIYSSPSLIPEFVEIVWIGE